MRNKGQTSQPEGRIYLGAWHPPQAPSSSVFTSYFLVWPPHPETSNAVHIFVTLRFQQIDFFWTPEPICSYFLGICTQPPASQHVPNQTPDLSRKTAPSPVLSFSELPHCPHCSTQKTERSSWCFAQSHIQSPKPCFFSLPSASLSSPPSLCPWLSLSALYLPTQQAF